MPDLYVKRLPQTDPRLGRHVVHDERSRSFPLTGPIDTSTWRSLKLRRYDPRPTPNQVIGNCTGCAKGMQFNTVGNRVMGRVLNMDDADRIYSLATTLDPWEGSYTAPSWEDTGSSTLAAAKAAQALGIGGAYYWEFRGALGVIQQVQNRRSVNVGTRWDNNMFRQDANGEIHTGGGVAGGHSWIVDGFDIDTELADAACWWGDRWRRFKVSVPTLDELLADDGDAHTQDKAA